MTVWCLGSINADHVYRLARLPAAGETLAATAMTTGLGGKGANQSIAASRAGARVVHIGAVGRDGGWMVDRLAQSGILTESIAVLDDASSGHAIIYVADDAENVIVVHPGANRSISRRLIEQALSQAEKGDTLLLQNETNAQPEAARIARLRGMRIVYSAAPFDVDAVKQMLPLCELLIANQHETDQLCAALGQKVEDLPVSEVLVTRGADGAEWRSGTEVIRVPAFVVTPVDTTGAGDTFAGYFSAARDMGESPQRTMQMASAAAALQVTRHGAAVAIPTWDEVLAFLTDNV